MHLKLCTITGADDHTPVEELIRLSAKYPFVEWGILVGSNEGIPRFPSSPWRSQLLAAAHPLKLSAHLCGKFLRAMLVGQRPNRCERFQRAQLNWHGQDHWQVDHTAMHAAMLEMPAQQFIFQLDGVNDAHLQAAKSAGVNAAAIFDRSHGAGVLPDEWPTPIPGVLCTYSGGLGPHNLEAQLVAIDKAAVGEPVCIDMETRVRSIIGGKDVLDLEKVERCLQLASKYVP